MKRHLVAFLSMIGLISSASPLGAQVLKGAKEKTKSKTEQTIKLTNANKEMNATSTQIQAQRKDKWKKVDAENKAAKNDAEKKALKNETLIKGGKTAANSTSAQTNSKLKLQQQTLRNQNTANGQKNALTKAGLTKAALTKAKGSEQK